MRSKAESLRHNHLNGRLVLGTVSGVVTTKPEIVELFDRTVPDCGLITTKSYQVTANSGNREPIICSPETGSFGNSVGLRNPGMNYVYPDFEAMRRKGTRALINVSVSASCPEDFITLVKRFDPVADLIELNFSCPHAAKGFGASIGGDKAIAEEYVRKIHEATRDRNALLIIKLTPNVDNIGQIAKAVIDAGADGIAAINTVGPKLYIDEVSKTPILNNRLGGKGGASGEWVHQDAIKAIREIREAIGDDPIILGMGGVTTSADARDLIEAGADSVNIGSALSRVMPDKWSEYYHRIASGMDVSDLVSDKNPMEYRKHSVESVAFHGDDVMILTLSGKCDCAPGEFAFLWVPGHGEKPFSVARNNPFTFLIKKRGEFTSFLFTLKEGDDVYVRGLYGKPMEYRKSRRALLIAGGSGVAVLPLIAEKLEKDGTEMDIRVGIVRKGDGRDPLEDVLEQYGSYMSVADDGKPGRVLDTLGIDSVSGDVSAYIVGPGKMMEAASRRLESLGLSDDRIYLSMEKNTMCGIGMCGECVCGGHFPCKEGTFFTWHDLKANGADL
ncbi:MAG: dihydroorotate dehydrogenase [Candidatus Ornithospirochaeta sp.]|nr:dihydroorotate dehydrogenase [Candidatus Ornithospirochaeta sp.]